MTTRRHELFSVFQEVTGNNGIITEARVISRRETQQKTSAQQYEQLENFFERKELS